MEPLPGAAHIRRVRQGSVGTAMEIAFIPSPSRGVYHLRTDSAARLRVLHHHRCLRRGLARQQALARPRWPTRHGGRHRGLGRALRPGRRPPLPRDHGLRAVLQRGPRLGGRLQDLGGRPRYLGRDRPRRAGRVDRLPPPRNPAARLGRRPRPRYRARPGDRPLGQLVQPGAVRAGRPTVPWALQITSSTDGRVPGYYHPTFLYESLWCVGVALLVIWADRRFTLGPRPGVRAVRRDLLRRPLLDRVPARRRRPPHPGPAAQQLDRDLRLRPRGGLLRALGEEAARPGGGRRAGAESADGSAEDAAEADDGDKADAESAEREGRGRYGLRPRRQGRLRQRGPPRTGPRPRPRRSRRRKS